MKYGILLGLSFVLLTGCSSTTPTRTTESAYMVIDVKGDTDIRNELLNAIIKEAQVNMSKLTVNRGVPPSELPEKPQRFELIDPFENSQMGGLMALAQASGASTKIPSCKDPILTMQTTDDARNWGERTTFFICVVQYVEGYQVNMYTTFEQQTGGVSINALSASLARSVVGDTSQVIPITMDNIKTTIANVGSSVTIVDSYIPENWKGLFSDI